MRVLIVEDEPIAASRLTELFDSVSPDATIVGTTASIAETLDWFQKNGMPDLVMMDINLADGSCFSLFDVIEITAPIIFCTAYDEYALKAFQSNGIAYLLKPVLESDLRSALDKLAVLQGASSSGKAVLRSMSNATGGYKSRFLIRAGDKLLPVPVADIACFMAQEQGVKLYLKSGDSYFLDYTVSELEQLLDPEAFFRISRQAIIAGDAVVSATATIRHTRVILSCMPQELAVARERARAFRNWLDN